MVSAPEALFAASKKFIPASYAFLMRAALLSASPSPPASDVVPTATRLIIRFDFPSRTYSIAFTLPESKNPRGVYLRGL